MSETVQKYRKDDDDVYSTHLAVFEMADWAEVAEMLKEYLTFYGDYYTLNRKVTVIEHKCADPNLVLK